MALRTQQPFTEESNAVTLGKESNFKSALDYAKGCTNTHLSAEHGAEKINGTESILPDELRKRKHLTLYGIHAKDTTADEN